MTETLSSEATAEWIYLDLVQHVRPDYTAQHITQLTHKLNAKAWIHGFRLDASVPKHIHQQVNILRRRQGIKEAS